MQSTILFGTLSKPRKHLPFSISFKSSTVPWKLLMKNLLWLQERWSGQVKHFTLILLLATHCQNGYQEPNRSIFTTLRKQTTTNQLQQKHHSFQKCDLQSCLPPYQSQENTYLSTFPSVFHSAMEAPNEEFRAYAISLYTLITGAVFRSS